MPVLAVGGESFDELLQSVPGSTFKYLPKELIDSLGLRKYLLYDEEVLLVCEGYSVAYRDLQLLEKRPRCGGVVVTGQPGIGP